jgi:hypothetical protein
MGQIQRLKDRVVVRFSVDEILTIRVAASKNVTFSLAEMISKIAEMKATQKIVHLPKGVVTTTFDLASHEFVVTFVDDLGKTI